MECNAPLLALTMGDPAGIGPEIIAGAWESLFELRAEFGSDLLFPRPIVFGEPTILRRALALRKISADVVSLSSLSEIPDDYLTKFGKKTIPCLNCCSPKILDWLEESCQKKRGSGDDNHSLNEFPIGEIDSRCGDAAFCCLNRAIDAALDGSVDAIVTAPLHKKSLNLAGHHFPGHTEILASRCHIDDFAMMLYLGPQENLRSESGLAVVHVTLHTAMKNVFAQLTQEAVSAKSYLIRDFMRTIKGSEPRIGVCALNCHNGEEGLFGDEELKIIRPAVEQCREEGLQIAGPFPSDTLMLDAKNGVYDGIVAIYHDQGHIAVKLLDMHHAVNITLGLPIIRTSVAHGTAFDRAWQGTAKITSLIEAVRVAVLLANDKNRTIS